MSKMAADTCAFNKKLIHSYLSDGLVTLRLPTGKSGRTCFYGRYLRRGLTPATKRPTTSAAKDALFMLLSRRQRRGIEMVNKKCKRCEKVLPISAFYVHPQMADGHLNICKDCVRNRAQVYRQENLERIREYDRQRGRTKEHNQKNLQLAHDLKATNPEKYKEQKEKRNSNYVQKHPDRRRAHIMVWNKLRDKKLDRKPCEVCGTARKVEAHHDDYSKPLEIRWLCKKHHMELHRAINDKRRSAKQAQGAIHGNTERQ